MGSLYLSEQHYDELHVFTSEDSPIPTPVLSSVGDPTSETRQLVNSLAATLRIPQYRFARTPAELGRVAHALRGLTVRQRLGPDVFPGVVAQTGEVVRQATGARWELRPGGVDGRTVEPWLVFPRGQDQRVCAAVYMAVSDLTPNLRHVLQRALTLASGPPLDTELPADAVIGVWAGDDPLGQLAPPPIRATPVITATAAYACMVRRTTEPLVPLPGSPPVRVELAQVESFRRGRPGKKLAWAITMRRERSEREQSVDRYHLGRSAGSQETTTAVVDGQYGRLLYRTAHRDGGPSQDAASGTIPREYRS